MKITTWNIRQGGAKLKVARIAEVLVETDADVLVVTEFQARHASLLQNRLREAGYAYQEHNDPPLKTNGLLVASRRPMVHVSLDDQDYRPENPFRWLEVILTDEVLSVLALHIPEWGSKWDKAAFWREVNRFAKDRLNTKTIMIGDFNTGGELDVKNEEFACAEYFAELVAMGWVDAWRTLHPDTREYTWRNPGGWFQMRLDNCMLSPVLAPRLKAAWHMHEVRLEEKLSDHSMLSVVIGETEDG